MRPLAASLTLGLLLVLAVPMAPSAVGWSCHQPPMHCYRNIVVPDCNPGACLADRVETYVIGNLHVTARFTFAQEFDAKSANDPNLFAYARSGTTGSLDFTLLYDPPLSSDSFPPVAPVLVSMGSLAPGFEWTGAMDQQVSLTRGQMVPLSFPLRVLSQADGASQASYGIVLFAGDPQFEHGVRSSVPFVAINDESGTRTFTWGELILTVVVAVLLTGAIAAVIHYANRNPPAGGNTGGTGGASGPDRNG